MTKSAFEHLIKDPGEARNFRFRAQLMIVLEQWIKNSGMSQEQVAEILSVQRTRVSDLVNGKIDRFSLDTLVNMVVSMSVPDAIEITVDITVSALKKPSLNREAL